MPKLILMLKNAVVSEIPLEKTVLTIGRVPSNDIAIDNLAVSGFHAKIIDDNGVYTLVDLNSTNGTFVNDRRISHINLNNNDSIMIGKHTIVFSDPVLDDDSDTTQNSRRVKSEETVLMDSRYLYMQPTPHNSTPYVEVPLGGFTVIDGPVEKRDYKLTGRLTTIGKSKTAEIRLKGFFAPRLAALVNRGKDGYSISPPGDGRKLVVNGVSVEGRVLLKQHDIVEVWKVKLQFYLNE